MEYLFEILRQHPELALFLTVAMGFLVGKVSLGSFKIGAVLGTLFSGLLIGLLDISIPSLIKTIFFDMFIFATGFKVGPQFFQLLKKDALPQILLTVIICVTSLTTVYVISKLLNYNMGTAAGLLAGAFTESTVIGTAGQAIERLAITGDLKNIYINSIPIAYAATYLVGTAAVVLFLPNVAPRLIRVNIKELAQKLDGQFFGKNQSVKNETSSNPVWNLRALQLNSTMLSGMTVEEIEYFIPEGRVIIERIRRNGLLLDAHQKTILQEGDVIAVTARQEVMVQLFRYGNEITDKELLDIPRQTVKIVVTKRAAAGKTLRELAELYRQGIVLQKLTRTGVDMPFDTDTVVNRGDCLVLDGHPKYLERTSKELGFVEPVTPDTDILFVALGIFIGGILGSFSLTLFGVPVALSASGGALVMGLFFGWLRSHRPTFGRIPDAALWIFDTLGLTVFIGVVGISAGPGLISGLSHTGFSIILVALAVALLPHVIGLYFGYYILKMNPVMLLGAQSGAGTSTSALKSLQDVAGSKLPVLGYTIPYALGNILLTAWGPVIVGMLS